MSDLLPPAGLALLALLLLLGRWWRLGTMTLTVLVALSMDGASRLLISGLDVPSAPPGPLPGAIVILPGEALEALNPAGTPPGIYTLARLRSGAALQRQTALPILVTGGRAPGETEAEAKGMAASLRRDFRVPVRWEETRSQNLWQSAAYSAAMLQADGVSRVYLVADAPDERLATSAFRRAGVVVTPAPVRRPDPLTLEPSIFLTFAPAWLESGLALRQWAGLACDAVPACVAWMTGAAVRPDPS